MRNITPDMMQQFQNKRGQGQGRTRDTSGMRRMMNMRNSQPGTVRDTSGRRRRIIQNGQQPAQQNAATPVQPTVKK